ncbi:MAG TPA: GNAT family N-acetyltransferase [Geminicoccaceae bacterium]|nr:GNAT family N-acetyltransferase [Geminicoccus sp.]HMU51939.1 GNAT family N-acetyltransferase [Geminicoccaceae bacterium]
MSTTIRPWRPVDGAAVTELILPIQRQEFGIAITLADQPDLLDVPGFYLGGRGGFWVAEGGGRVVGTIALKDIGGGDAALRKMFVAAEFRGAGAGVARGLLAALLAHARRAGLERIWLGTTGKFLAAHRFYEKHGFTAVDAATLPAAFPRMAVDTRFYRLDLADVR